MVAPPMIEDWHSQYWGLYREAECLLARKLVEYKGTPVKTDFIH